MAQALNFDGITYCPATYAENLFTITDRNAGYDGLKLGEAKFVFRVCHFVNYLAYFFALRLA